jgi:hypothetical protein
MDDAIKNALDYYYTKLAELKLKMIENATKDAKEYHGQVQNITKNLGALNAVYEMELQDANNHLKAMNKFYANLTNAMQTMSEEKETSQEGCLSAPGEYTDISRFKHIFVFFASPEGPDRLSKTGPFRGASGRGGGCYVVRCRKTPRVVKEALPRHWVICRPDGSQTGSHVNGDFPERHLLFLNLRMQQPS